jgi:hypothetical protein
VVPNHFERVDALDLRLPVRIGLVVNAGFGPSHATRGRVGESFALFVFSIAFVAEPSRRLGEYLIDWGIANLARDIADFLAVGDLLPSDGIYNGIDLVKFKAGAFLYVLHYLLSSSRHWSPARNLKSSRACTCHCLQEG